MSSDELSCPRCTLPMTPIAGDRGRALGCEQCGGAWLDHERFGAVRQHDDTFVRRVVDELAARAPMRPRASSQPTRCPECAAVMSRTLVSSVELDYCGAHGAWFDRGELASVAEVVAALRAEAARAEPRPTSRSAAEASADGPRGPSAGELLGDAALGTAGAVGSLLGVVAEVLHTCSFHCFRH